MSDTQPNGKRDQSNVTLGVQGRRALIMDIVRRAFPNGTNPVLATTEDHKSSPVSGVDASALWKSPPDWPPDLFGISAFLLERSGLYQYFTPGADAEREQIAPMRITPARREELNKAVQDWKSSRRAPEFVATQWSVLTQEGEKSPLQTVVSKRKPFPVWARAALEMLIVSDEVCESVGFVVIDENKSTQAYDGPELNGADKENIIVNHEINLENGAMGINYFAAAIAKLEAMRAKQANRHGGSELYSGREEKYANASKSERHVLLKHHNYSISSMVSLDMFAVQPKCRTAQIGATMRTFSRNLTLLPPPSRMKASWSLIPRGMEQKNAPEALNLLLIPFPYKIDRDYFDATSCGDDEASWGWFEVRQKWLGKDAGAFANAINALFKKAKKFKSSSKSMEVHGVLFPEYSMNWEHQIAVADLLAKKQKSLEFIVSGSSSNCEGEIGNFVLNSFVYSRDEEAAIHHNSRGKHHRWRIDGGQSQIYDLDSILGCEKFWWERIDLQNREIHSVVFRPNSCFTSLICEDLARSDPCHESIRSVGANLVFCLLMDNVQVPVRWPARYAAALTDDPGTSVLTFTSRALIELANRKLWQKPRKGIEIGWDVAMWRDPTSSEIRTLACPPNHHAILLELEARSVPEYTYDGRKRDSSITWVYKRHTSFGLDSDDPHCRALGADISNDR